MDEKVLAFLLGLIQGVFEWLPVSSKTILMFLLYAWSSTTTTSYILSIFLNGSTVLAAVLYFRREILRILRTIFYRNDIEGFVILKFLIVSTLITGLFGVPISLLLIEFLSSLSSKMYIIFIGALFSITALLNWMRFKIKNRFKTMEEAGLREAFIAGLAQSFSTIPGVSRSGVTILALTIMGFKPRDSLTLSFLMSIPVTFGGSLYMYLVSPRILETLDFEMLIIAFSTALITSILLISVLFKLADKLKPQFFLITLSVVTVILGLFFS
ncbi:MAG: undecaprenyl-diphosphate phosphatase [Nitrososphaerota archaeon]|nr:hypothetical protein [Candidatus Geocrenenecus dongiae]